MISNHHQNPLTFISKKHLLYFHQRVFLPIFYVNTTYGLCVKELFFLYKKKKEIKMIISITGTEEELRALQLQMGLPEHELQLSLLAHQTTNEMPPWRKTLLDLIFHGIRPFILLLPNASPVELVDFTRSVRALIRGIS
jgi:hypothetical protein